jgi:hypothetical protein
MHADDDGQAGERGRGGVACAVGQTHDDAQEQREARAFGCDGEKDADIDASAFEDIRAPEMQRDGGDFKSDADQNSRQADDQRHAAGADAGVENLIGHPRITHSPDV